jgi:transcriptional regulator with XRE-family HTH domain
MAPERPERLRELGAFIREQREHARLSVRRLSELANVSNPYLSQIERGLHQPSVRVLKLISEALDVSAETLLAQAGLLDPDRVAPGAAPSGTGAAGTSAYGASPAQDAESAIRADQRLTDDQKSALITVYRSMLRSE